jgi:hypothetical protein
VTQPVQEPSPQRVDSSLAWGERQLRRRPAPVCSAGGDPWVFIDSGATTAPDNTWMPVPFEQICYDPGLVTQGDIFDWESTDVGDPGNDRWEVRCVLEGWYYEELITYWQNLGTDGSNDFGYAVHQERPFVSGVAAVLYPELRASADWPKNDITSDFEMLDNPYLRSSSRVWLPGDNKWKPQAKQTTGVDRDLSGIKFLLVYLGASDSSDWTCESV